MPSNLLTALQKGLNKLKASHKTQHENNQAALAAQQPVSKADEAWLDSDANLIDEMLLLRQLQSVPDCEKAVEELDEKGKSIVKRLREVTIHVAAAPTVKHKCT